MDTKQEPLGLDFKLNYPYSYKLMLINEWIPNALNREVLIKRFCDDMSYEAISQIMDRTPGQIRNIIVSGLEQIYNHIDSDFNKIRYLQGFNVDAKCIFDNYSILFPEGKETLRC
jgi:hypothetical protein